MMRAQTINLSDFAADTCQVASCPVEYRCFGAESFCHNECSRRRLSWRRFAAQSRVGREDHVRWFHTTALTIGHIECGIAVENVILSSETKFPGYAIDPLTRSF